MLFRRAARAAKCATNAERRNHSTLLTLRPFHQRTPALPWFGTLTGEGGGASRRTLRRLGRTNRWRRRSYVARIATELSRSVASGHRRLCSAVRTCRHAARARESTIGPNSTGLRPRLCCFAALRGLHSAPPRSLRSLGREVVRRDAPYGDMARQPLSKHPTRPGFRGAPFGRRVGRAIGRGV